MFIKLLLLKSTKREKNNFIVRYFIIFNKEVIRKLEYKLKI